MPNAGANAETDRFARARSARRVSSVPTVDCRVVRGAALIGAALVAAGCSTGSGEGLDANGRPLNESGGGQPLIAEFASIQDNVLTPACTVCHAGAAAPLGLRLDAANSYGALVGVASVQAPGVLRVDPGNPDDSYLVQKLEGTAAAGERMPLGGPFLPQATVDVIRQWIVDGALPAAGPAPASPPVVVSTTPADGAVVPDLPAEIRVTFDRVMDASLVNDLTVELVASGGDGTFGDGNEVAVTALSVAPLPANGAVAVFVPDTVAADDDDYRLRVVGTGPSPLADNDGVVLDGDDNGQPGGDFTAVFTVALLDPTLEAIQREVFAVSCATAGCHTGPAGPALPAGLDLSGEAASFASLVDVPSVEFPSLDRVEPGSPDDSYLVQKLEGTAAVGAQMPLGGAPLDDRVVAAVRQWIADGASFGDTGPPDAQAPAVALSPPGGELSGTIALTAVAVDDTAVVRVDFYVDDVLVGTDASEPFGFIWDTTTVSDGSHEVFAEAVDEAGNIGRSEAVAVLVRNEDPPADDSPPDVTVAVPASPLTGSVTLSATATDNVGVTGVTFLVDGAAIGTDATSPYAVVWDTTSVANGSYDVAARAADAAGNSATSAAVTVTVDNTPPADTTPPSAVLTAPASGTVSGTVTLAADASDDTGVSEVRFFADDDLLGSDATVPYSLNWDTTAVADGAYTLTAQAVDAAGNTGVSAAVSVTVDNTPTAVTGVDPANGSVLDAFPLAVTVTVDGVLQGASVTEAAVTLVRSGGDGVFDNGNDVAVPGVAVALAPDGRSATVDLTGVSEAEDTYRLVVVGDGADAWLDSNGVVLDGDGDGVAGGDLVTGFSVDGLVASLASIQNRVFDTRCAFCHGGFGNDLPGVMNIASTAASFDNLVGVPSIQEPTIPRVDPFNADGSYLIHKLEGTQEDGDRMPQGGPFLDDATVGAIRRWIDKGAEP